MRTRRETVEHPFGTLKMRMGATHFLMKTLPKVATEMALHVLAYNLTRVMNIVGIKPLLVAIQFRVRRSRRGTSPPLPWTWGFAFPLKRLESRLRCPRCGSRRMTAGGSRPTILIFNMSAGLATPVPKKYPGPIRERTWRIKSRSCGRSSVVERQLPKLYTRVRFPPPAPALRKCTVARIRCQSLL